jgi:hypothetical protein
LTDKNKTDFKSVEIGFEEYATIVVGASSDEEATEYITKTFNEVPALRIIEIRDTSPEELSELQSKHPQPQRTLN